MSIKIKIVVALPFFLSASVVGAGDWSTWRGAQRDGHVPGFEAPEPWPDALTRRWAVAVGEGHAGPVVAGDRLFVHTRQGDDEVVRAIDLVTGGVVWRQAYAVAFQPADGAGVHGNSPKATPAVADGRLFTFSIDGRLTAWQAASGERIWQRDATGFESRAPLWGHASSPLVDGERIIAHFGGPEHGALIAADVASGKLLWSLGDAGPSYASPVVARLGASRQIVTLDEAGVIGVDATNGQLLWRFPFPQTYNLQNSITPIVADDTIFVAGEDRGVLALRLREGPDGWQASKLWHHRAYSPDMSSPVLVDGLLVGLAYERKGMLFALDPTTGKVRWTGPGRTGSYAALIAIPGQVVVQTEDAEVLLIHADATRYRELASFRVADAPTWAHPVLLDDGLVVKDTRSVVRWAFGSARQER